MASEEVKKCMGCNSDDVDSLQKPTDVVRLYWENKPGRRRCPGEHVCRSCRWIVEKEQKVSVQHYNDHVHVQNLAFLVHSTPLYTQARALEATTKRWLSPPPLAHVFPLSLVETQLSHQIWLP